MLFLFCTSFKSVPIIPFSRLGNGDACVVSREPDSVELYMKSGTIITLILVRRRSTKLPSAWLEF